MPFPATPILDDCDRPNESPAVGWVDGPDGIAYGGVQILSGELAPISGDSWSYFDESIGADCEFYATLPQLPAGNMEFYFCMSPIGSASADGYVVRFINGVTNVCRIGRSDNTGFSQLGADIPLLGQGNGDSFGVRRVGDEIFAYYKAAAGSWTELGSRTDSTYTHAGYFAPYFPSGGYRLVDFGGGNLDTSTVTFVLQAAFGADVDDASYDWTTIGSSANPSSSYLRSFRYSRGRQNERQRMEAGTGDILLRDFDSHFDPTNTASPFYPDVRPMCPIRVVATIAGTDYPMFQHYAERWPRTLRIKTTYTERQLATVDGFAWLALAGLAGEAYSEELSSDRLTAVLDDVDWPAALRSIATGDSYVAAAVFEDDDSTKALEHLQVVGDTEDGMAFINAAGEVQLINRHTLIVDAIAPATATFMDGLGSDPDGVEYQELEFSYDLDNVVNEWTGTREGGTPQTETDLTSRGHYGLRSAQFTSVAINDEEVLASVQWKLAQFKDPQQRIASVTLMPGWDTTLWETLLSLELGDRITLLETPPGFTSEQEAIYQIQHLDVTVPQNIVGATFTYQLWPASDDDWFILDDTTFGVLNQNQLAY